MGFPPHVPQPRLAVIGIRGKRTAALPLTFGWRTVNAAQPAPLTPPMNVVVVTDANPDGVTLAATSKMSATICR